jgi:membrane associated rhomboid family serine protease
MIPLIDENPLHRVPWVTMALIAVCTAVFFLVQPTGKGLFDNLGFDRVQRQDLEFSLRWAAIPCEISEARPLSIGEARATFVDGNSRACGEAYRDGPAVKPQKSVWLSVLVSIFLHGSVSHLAGNMLFLWVFGNNIEDRRGAFGFASFYVAAGLVATAAQFLLNPHSTVPIIGASGAIAGVMGAYFVWFPDARIKSLIIVGPAFFRKVKAKWLLSLWFAEQFLLIGGTGDIAWAAHVGGFAFGVVTGLVWRRSDDTATHRLSAPAA